MTTMVFLKPEEFDSPSINFQNVLCEFDISMHKTVDMSSTPPHHAMSVEVASTSAHHMDTLTMFVLVTESVPTFDAYEYIK